MIDIRTFMLVLAIGNIGLAMLMAGYSRSGATNPSMSIWAWAKLAQGCGNLLMWLRPDLPLGIVVVAANAALIIGAALEVAAYCTFFGFANWRRVLYPCTALALLVFYGAISGSLNQLLVVMSIIIALFSGSMAFMLLTRAEGHSLLRRVIGINDGLFFLAMSVRAAYGLMHGEMTLFTPALVQSVFYMFCYLLMIVNGFGFLLLCKQKDDQKMVELATTDSLTGLVNRRAFFDRTESARLLAARLRSPIALMMIDIDHFKRLNDRFGHATGDEALCVFAATVNEALREHDFMGRLGGEEFALVLPGTDIDGALIAAERLRLAIAAAVLPTGGNQYSMTVSIGVVVVDPGEHINSALARADHALYAAKSAGRDRVEVGTQRLVANG